MFSVAMYFLATLNRRIMLNNYNQICARGDVCHKAINFKVINSGKKHGTLALIC